MAAYRIESFDERMTRLGGPKDGFGGVRREHLKAAYDALHRFFENPPRTLHYEWLAYDPETCLRYPWQYGATLCMFQTRGGLCSKGAKCNMAHNATEMAAHPAHVYSKVCVDPFKCDERRCLDAHASDEVLNAAERKWLLKLLARINATTPWNATPAVREDEPPPAYVEFVRDAARKASIEANLHCCVDGCTTPREQLRMALPCTHIVCSAHACAARDLDDTCIECESKCYMLLELDVGEQSTACARCDVKGPFAGVLVHHKTHRTRGICQACVDGASEIIGLAGLPGSGKGQATRRIDALRPGYYTIEHNVTTLEQLRRIQSRGGRVFWLSTQHPKRYEWPEGFGASDCDGVIHGTSHRAIESWMRIVFYRGNESSSSR